MSSDAERNHAISAHRGACGRARACTLRLEHIVLRSQSKTTHCPQLKLSIEERLDDTGDGAALPIAGSAHHPAGNRKRAVESCCG